MPPLPLPRRAPVVWILALLPLLWGCEEDPRPTIINVNPGAVSFDAVGESRPVAFQILDQQGNPMPSVVPQWSSANGLVATVTPGGVVTAAGGGSTQIAARAGDALGVVQVTVDQRPTEIRVVAGAGQTAQVAGALPSPIQVEVVDRLGSPAPGIAVTSAAVGAAGSLQPPTVTTGPGGRAQFTWTLGTTSGAQQARFNVTPSLFAMVGAQALPGPPAALELASGQGQSGPAGANLGTPVAVRVADAFGNGVQGVAVNFSVTAGGGTVTPTSTATGNTGVASATWRLGPATGSQSARATSPGLGSVDFGATATPPAFNIEARFLGSAPAVLQQSVQRSLDRWAEIVVGKLPPTTVNAPAGSCGSGSPALNEVVDDLLILVSVQALGQNVLGAASPCFIRTASGLTVVGRIVLADNLAQRAPAFVDAVVIHEIGHVLGLGTLPLWDANLRNPSLPDNQGADTHWDGPRAVAAFNASGGAGYPDGKVPVENQAGQGSGDSHWRESVLGNELMTPFLNPNAANPLSLITAEALGDMGYQVDPSRAEPFTLGAAALMPGAEPPVLLKDDILPLPIYMLDEEGRIVGRVR